MSPLETLARQAVAEGATDLERRLAVTLLLARAQSAVAVIEFLRGELARAERPRLELVRSEHGDD